MGGVKSRRLRFPAPLESACREADRRTAPSDGYSGGANCVPSDPSSLGYLPPPENFSLLYLLIVVRFFHDGPHQSRRSHSRWDEAQVVSDLPPPPMGHNIAGFDDEDLLDVEPAPPPRDADLTRVATLARRAQEEQEAVIALTEELQRAINAHNLTVEKELPEAMVAVGLSAYKLTDGTPVEIKRTLTGTKLTNPEGLDWVEAHDGADVIKTIITVELPKDELGTAREIADLLRSHPKAGRFVKLELERSVHQSTIAAFAREARERNENPPLDKLGVFERTRAVVGASRPKTVELKGLTKR